MSLTKAEIESIVTFRAPAPQGYRHITLESGVRWLEAEILRRQAVYGDDVLVHSEVVRDAQGQPLLDPNGRPKVVDLSCFKRDVASDIVQLRTTLEITRNEWRVALQQSADEAHEQAALAWFRREQAEKRAQIKAAIETTAALKAEVAGAVDQTVPKDLAESRRPRARKAG